MFVTLIVIAVTTLVAYLLYAYKSAHSFYEKRSMKYFPGVPLFGNMLQSILNRRHTLDDVQEIYSAFPDDKYVGFIEGMSPTYLVRDPEIIKLITIKNFDHFANHKLTFPPDAEPLFGGSLFMMRDDKWRDMRLTLTPAFTSSKIRLMMPFMMEICNNIMDHLKEHLDEDVDVDDLVHRYTNDVIASTAFGVQINSLKEKDNEFYNTGKNLFEFGLMKSLFFFASAFCPSICKKLGITIFPRQVISFFTNLIDATIEHREKNNIVRQDMIHLMLEACKGTLKGEKDDDKPVKPPREWSRGDLMSQMFLFFAAGFETVASAMGMAIHELALNSDVQEKLYQEIKEHKLDSELTFDNVSTLKYLDCVVHETLRKWSPGILLDRECTKPYVLPPPREGEKPVKVSPGEVVYCVVNCIHRDPKYYPNPEVFDPERFRDDKKHIQTSSFLPFGMGPRNCIGLRFAMLEMKVILYNMVLNFKITKCPKTTDPIEIKPHNFNVKVLGGTWVKYEARQ